MGFTKNILKAKIVPVFVVFLLVVIVVVTAVVAYGRSKDSARTDALEKLDIIATDREFRLNQFVDDQLQEITRISRIPTIRDISDELLSLEMEPLHSKRLTLPLIDLFYRSQPTLLACPRSCF